MFHHKDELRREWRLQRLPIAITSEGVTDGLGYGVGVKVAGGGGAYE
jgi:hypothetical protein